MKSRFEFRRRLTPLVWVLLLSLGVGVVRAQQPPAPATGPQAPKTPPTTQPKSIPKAPKSKPKAPELTARQLLAKVVEVSGGDKLKALKSLRWEAVESRVINEFKLDRTILGRARFPEHMRIEVSFRDPNTRVDRTLVFALNGNNGWTKNGEQTSVWPPAQVNQQRGSLLCSTTPLLQVADQLQVKMLDKSILGATDYHRIEVRRDKLEPVILWIHPKDFTIRRRQSKTMRNGQAVQHEEQLWDYRPVDGLLLPYSRKIFENGRETALFSINRYMLNEEYGDDIFAKPSP